MLLNKFWENEKYKNKNHFLKGGFYKIIES